MSNYDVALDLLNHSGKINKTSDLYLCDEDGWSIAHTAAVQKKLPSYFHDWELADYTGYSVAHAAASIGALPLDFDQWDIKDIKGKSVAEIAAELGTLPDTYFHWDRVTESGNTLAHIAAKVGRLPTKLLKSKEILKLKNKEGKTVDDFVRERAAMHLETMRNILKKAA